MREDIRFGELGQLVSARRLPPGPPLEAAPPPIPRWVRIILWFLNR